MALKKYPGFIDVHVHLREPGATNKEDFYTGSRAAVSGGFTLVLDMPNNPVPTFSISALKEKMRLSAKAICEVGFHYGTDGKNIESFPNAWKNENVYGLKVYCNHTTGEYLVEDIYLLEQIFENWKSDKPILVHAQGKELAAVIALSHLYNRHLHVCHISQAIEVELIRKAKYKKQWITAGVTPHHLFLTNKDLEKIGNRALMKPLLGSKKDQDVLWEGISDGTIDLIESDHAPHTLGEKEGDKPAFGVPGLETTVGLLFKAVSEKKLSEQKVINLLYTHPKKIFSTLLRDETYIELDPDTPWVVDEKKLQTKCNWSPFDGWELYGKVMTVVIDGKLRLENGKII